MRIPAVFLRSGAIFPRLIAAGSLLLALSSPTFAQFTDVTGPSGLFGAQPTWGGVLVDMDGDGDLDCMNSHHFYSGFIFTNDGTGQFSVWGIPQLVTGLADRHAWTWVDLDNDSVLDVICSHGGGGGCGCSDDGNELWRGLGGGTYDVIVGAGGMLDEIGRGRAFSAADIDQDGDADLWHAQATLAAAPNRLYRNDGSLNFVDVATSWGVDETLGTVGVLFADYDDDGDPDALLGGDEDSRPTTLYRNDGGTFTDVTAATLGSLPIIASAAWGDLDNDEDLDLVLVEGQEGVYDAFNVDGLQYTFFANHRFSEDGVDVFEFDTPIDDPTAQFRWRGTIANERVFLGPSGVNPTQSSITLTNAFVGAPTFTPGVDEGVYCWRDAPDGRWNVHVSAPAGTFGNYSLKLNTVAGVFNPTGANLEQLTVPKTSPRVFRNDGNGQFTDVSGALRIPSRKNPRHVTLVDFDQDGDLDLHQVNRGTVETGNVEDVLWELDGLAVPVVERSGAGWAPGFDDRLADGAIWGDVDDDGDLDVLVQEGAGPTFYTQGTPALHYRNDHASGHWLRVQIEAATGNTTAIGTKVTAWANGTPIHRRVEANNWRGFVNMGPAKIVD